MRKMAAILLTVTALVALPVDVDGSDISLGTAGNFAVLAGTTVTNTGLTTIKGDAGVYSGTSMTGFGSVTLTGTEHVGDATAHLAQTDLALAYTAATSLASGMKTVLSGQDLGTVAPLTPGVYYFATSAQLTGTLILNDDGNPNAQFVFLIGTTLTTAAGSSVESTGSLAADSNVIWQVGTSATLGGGTAFEGSILAYTDITMGVGATMLNGRALAENGAVSLDANDISIGSVPEPASLTLALFGVVILAVPAIWTRSTVRLSRGEQRSNTRRGSVVLIRASIEMKDMTGRT